MEFFGPIVAVVFLGIITFGFINAFEDPIGDAIRDKMICISDREHGVEFKKCWDLVERKEP